MKRITRTTFAILSSFSLVGGIALGVGFSLARFVATDDAEQMIYPAGGEAKKSIFLDCESMWNNGYGEVFKMHVWKNSDGSVNADLLPSKKVNLTLTGQGNPGTRDVYVFLLDTTVYDRFLFYRYAPDGTSLWNRTYNITYESAKNYFLITSFISGGNYYKYKEGTIASNGAISGLSSEIGTNS